MTAPRMAEHRKLAQLQDRIEVLQGFLGFLADTEYRIARYDDYGELIEVLDVSGNYVYNYFGIDPAALEAEREEAVRYVLDH